VASCARINHWAAASARSRVSPFINRTAPSKYLTWSLTTNAAKCLFSGKQVRASRLPNFRKAQYFSFRLPLFKQSMKMRKKVEDFMTDAGTSLLRASSSFLRLNGRISRKGHHFSSRRLDICDSIPGSCFHL
jgi:hypothetical protein